MLIGALALGSPGLAQPASAQPRPADEPAAASTQHGQPGAGAGPGGAQAERIAPSDIAAPTIAERRQESRHAVVVDGRTIGYIATPGR